LFTCCNRGNGGVVESAPTSPYAPSDGGREGKKDITGYELTYHGYKMAALSSSAPELEGMWTEVRRKQRAKALKGSATAEVGWSCLGK